MLFADWLFKTTTFIWCSICHCLIISYPTLNIRGKKRIRKGQMVEFSIVSVEGGKFKANEVNLV